MRKWILLMSISAGLLLAQMAPGTYSGSWSGAASGDFKMTLTQKDGVWGAEVVFGMGGESYQTKVKSVKVDGSKVEVVYQYSLQGTDLQSDVIGELKGKTIEGTYKATTVTDGSAVDEGTWKAASAG